MELQIGKCAKCGTTHTLIPSNNSLVSSICTTCAIKDLDYNKVEDADLFCRTFNYPFRPEVWIKMSKEFKQDTFKKYVEEFIDINQGYDTNNKELWKNLDKEWELVKTHEHLLDKIQPIKEGYMLRNHIKWGSNYTFEELIALENLYVNTLKANDISNPMQKDAIKKACKMSVALDRAIINGDSKEINELSKSYQNFVKTAKIEDLITASSQDVISNVAQLVKFIEDEGFEFKYYDNVDRDIVDKSLKDIQAFLQRLVLDATGLESVFESINTALKKEDAVKKDAESFEKVPLEELYQAALDDKNKDFDKELEDEELTIEENEDEYF